MGSLHDYKRDLVNQAGEECARLHYLADTDL